MGQDEGHKGVVYAGSALSDEEAELLAGAGFVVKRVESVRLPLESEEPASVACSISEAVTSGDALVRDGLVSARTDSRASAEPSYGIDASEDIAESKSHEAVLRKYRIFSQNSRDIILFVGRDGLIIEANEAAVAAYGYSRDELLALTIFDLRAPGTVYATEEQMAAADSDGILFETTHRRKDGSTFPVEVSSRGTDIDGQRVLLSVIRDITERKQSEEALRDAQSQVAINLDAMTRLHQVGLLYLQEGNLETVLTEIVDAAIDISAADFGNIQLLDPSSHSLKIVAHRGFPNWWLDFWNSVSEGKGDCGTALERGERVVIEDVEQSPIFVNTQALEIQLKAGVRAVQSTPLVSRSGKPLGMFSTHYKTARRPDDGALRLLDLLARQAADIIERKQSEEGLRESERRMSIIFGSIADGFYALDREWKITDINDEALRYFGRKREEMQGRTIHEVFAGFGGSVFEAEYRRAMETNEPRNFEAPSLVTSRTVDIHVYPSPESLTILFRDVTARKRAELELHKLNRTLEAHGHSSRAMVRAENESDYLAEVCRIVVEDCGHAMVWIGYAEDDAAKSIRPVACYGFEEGYLETLQLTWSDTERGRGPTGTAIRTGKPSMCRNMLTDPQFEPWREQALKRGYASSIVLPLRSGSNVFGAITIYSRDPDPFSENEVTLLSELADDLAHGITMLRLREERKQAEIVLQTTLQRFYDVLSSMYAAILLVTKDDRVEFANQAFCHMYGLKDSPADLVGLTAQQMMDRIRGTYARPDEAIARIKELVSLGKPAKGEEIALVDGITCIRDYIPIYVDGESHGRVWQHVDITERKKAEEELAKARADAERRAAESESFLSNLADGVSMIDSQGQTVWMNDAGREILRVPPGETISDCILRYQLFTVDGTPLAPEQAAGSRALRGERVTDFRYKTVTPFGDTVILSTSASPVFDGQGRVIGATSTFRDQSERVASENDIQSLLDRERHIAEVLQHSVLPSEVPSELLGHRIAVRYRPALREAEIGGDFYDVFELGDGRFAVVIGDVVGKGLRAAMRVASARHTIRSYAYLDPRPARVLTMANDSLCRDEFEEGRMLTLFYAVVDPGMGGIMYASAGHEPPAVFCAEGFCEELEVAGVPIGVMPGASYEQSSRRLHQGDILVMVTDGITEARTPRAGLFGKDRLIDFVQRHREESIEEIASGVMDAATSHAEGQLQDDAAIVVLAPQSRKADY